MSICVLNVFDFFSFRKTMVGNKMRAILRNKQIKKEAYCYYYYFAFPFLTNDVNVQLRDLQFLP